MGSFAVSGGDAENGGVQHDKSVRAVGKRKSAYDNPDADRRRFRFNGIKVTTMVVMLLTTVASARRSESVNIFKRRLSEQTLRQASAVCSIYLTAVVVCTMFICAVEPYSMKQVLFEVSSAIGTVGLSTGITAALSAASKIVLMILMYAGRVGGLTLMLVLAEKRRQVSLVRPVEDILIG